ncbi:acyltransferase family protein [Flavonifractor plautii]|nr:acyltransferase family protein [Flavonifractor plautii]
MLAVIVVHITGGALEASPVGTPDFMVLNVYDGLTHWCVPVFVMLSGMFLLDPKHSLPLQAFFGHMLRIAAALAVWGTAYALVERVQVHGLSWESVRAALYQVLLGKTCFHLWFLYMLLGLYLVTPVLRAFVRGQAGGFPLVFPAGVCLHLPPAHPSAPAAQPDGEPLPELPEYQAGAGLCGLLCIGLLLKGVHTEPPGGVPHLPAGDRRGGGHRGGTAWLSQQRGALAQTFTTMTVPTSP